jgi:nickel transport protein
MAKFRFAGLLFVLLGLADPAAGHGLRYHVNHAEAVVIRVTFANKTAFSHHPYEIIRPNETAPCFTGETDADGRIVFVPDSSGAWRIRTYSEDGHGLNITLIAEGGRVIPPHDEPAAIGYTRLLLGLVILLALFNLYALFYRRGKRPTSA